MMKPRYYGDEAMSAIFGTLRLRYPIERGVVTNWDYACVWVHGTSSVSHSQHPMAPALPLARTRQPSTPRARTQGPRPLTERRRGSGLS